MVTTSEASSNGEVVDILLIGLGSIGSVYAYMLEKSGRVRVTAVARSNYDLYTKSGVTLDTDRFGKITGWRPYRVVKTQAEALEGNVHYALCMICTKCLPDVLPTPTLVGDLIHSGKIGAWALLQNGLGVEEDLYQAVKHLDTPIISNCIWIGVMTNPDGSIVSWKGQDAMVAGIYPPKKPMQEEQTRVFSAKESGVLDLWVDALTAGEAKIKVDERIDGVRFSKNVWNCVWSSIQGLTRATPNYFAHHSAAEQAPLRAFIREIVETGFRAGLLREGMPLYPAGTPMGSSAEVQRAAWDSIVNMSLEKAKQGIPPHRMSLLIDVEMGRPFELEVITGAVAKVAKSHGYETPFLDFTYSLLKGVQNNIIDAQKKKNGGSFVPPA
ncbi:ketopantoate reductase PanE/ApbA C terminal-domain-containing protein [Naematelia encephala]|uniref:Ketopantoate reductase PanE/ApbA C terminal-domain-containing protein n=1 Tax=Naematelia encephala TaxID=71784 RepID=A0A1Y2BCT1_9TREE|nr:ketopantoate reductase PanE/ApbA C terminal-domain-containing protein [Naematelia encephala]